MKFGDFSTRAIFKVVFNVTILAIMPGYAVSEVKVVTNVILMCAFGLNSVVFWTLQDFNPIPYPIILANCVSSPSLFPHCLGQFYFSFY